MSCLLDMLNFYFSLTNLAHDKFLSDILLTSNSVPIKTLAKFNKLRSLSYGQDVEEAIRNAAQECSLLQLSEDGEHISLRSPVTQEDLDNYLEGSVDRTVYIENFPDDINHDCIHSLFSRVGNVMYVSLPRFSESRVLKGFGFVEMQNKEDAERAERELNGLVPKEWLQTRESKVEPLRVMGKREWLGYKEKYLEIKKRLRGEATTEKNEYLVKMEGIPFDADIKDIQRTVPYAQVQYQAPGTAILILKNRLSAKNLLKANPMVNSHPVICTMISSSEMPSKRVKLSEEL
jgi:hypothetical protein